MKKSLCCILAVVMVLILCTPALAVSDESTKLSQLSNSELLEFLVLKGVEIPGDNIEYWSRIARNIVKEVESNSQYRPMFNMRGLQEFAEAVSKVAAEYKGTALNNMQQPRLFYTLQDSTVYGSWSESYVNYNCYAYAIGRTEWANPGNISGAVTEDDTDTIAEASVNQLLGYIRTDLEHIGYSNVIGYTACPSLTSIHAHRRLICIRKDTDEKLDYHVMKYENGSWYHKPGSSNPLKYSYTPTTSMVWTNEAYFRYITYAPTITYDSSIMFITYDLPHTTIVYRPHSDTNGVHKHIPECSECGRYTASATNCIYKGGSETCAICGWNKNAALTALAELNTVA